MPGVDWALQFDNSIDAQENYRQILHVDTSQGSAGGDGLSWASAFSTMEAALNAANTGALVKFRGDVREEITGSNLKFDITIRGCGSLHHPDLPAAGYDPGAAMWRPPASPTAATPLLIVRGRGWKFENIAFDCPVDAAAVKLSRNALSGTSEYDASHATFENCRFLSGAIGIEDAGGGNNITIKNCEFAGITTVAITNTSTAVANPRAWKVFDNLFPANVSGLGNATHIDAALNESIIKGNFFGTVVSTALYVDLTGGNGNIVVDNHMMGSYSTDDYVAGTGDDWIGNRSIDLTETEVDTTTGWTIAVPAA